MSPDQMESLMVIAGGFLFGLLIYAWASWRSEIDGQKIDAARARARSDRRDQRR